MSDGDRPQTLPRGAGSGGDVPALPAASTIVLRGGDPFEILLMRRHERSTFVPGAWVFPGGGLEESDGAIASRTKPDDPLQPLRVCAVRELFEEAGVWVGHSAADLVEARRALLAGELAFDAFLADAEADFDRLVLTSRWITPLGIPKRYDTWFFLVEVPVNTVATPEFNEAMDMVWLTPAEALEREKAGELTMVFPTIRNLAAIAGFSSAAELLASRAGLDVQPIQPLLVTDGGKRRIVLPEER